MWCPRHAESFHDFDMFSMSDYRSCENCRHLNGENQCEKNLEEGRRNL